MPLPRGELHGRVTNWRMSVSGYSSAPGHSPHSRHLGVSGSPQERTFGQWPVANIRTAIATPVPMGSPGWRDVGRRARFQFFWGKFRRWAGRDFTTAVPETLAMVDGRMSTGTPMVAV